MAQGRAVSLFSGAGGLDVGFARAGFEVVLANDMDTHACATYALNHPQPILCGDLRDHWAALCEHRGVDVLFGGPPCQGFSVAGHQREDDPRSSLLWTYLDAVEALAVRGFVCENVKALGLGERWRTVREQFIARAEALGYCVVPVLMNAQDYGVPQSRERIFFFGVRAPLTRRAALQQQIEMSLQASRRPVVSVRACLRALPVYGQAGNPATCPAKITYCKRPVLRASPYAGMLFNGAGRPLDLERASLTLTATMGGNRTPIIDMDAYATPGTGHVLHYHAHLLAQGQPYTGTAPLSLRRLSLTEAAALQTFPLTYQFAGSASARYRQIGNAVPCELAQAVAQALQHALALDEHARRNA